MSVGESMGASRRGSLDGIVSRQVSGPGDEIIVTDQMQKVSHGHSIWFRDESPRRENAGRFSHRESFGISVQRGCILGLERDEQRLHLSFHPSVVRPLLKLHLAC